jgi:hypothetical protein
MLAEVWKPYSIRGPVCILENFKWFGEPCFVGAAILGDVNSKFPGGASMSDY